MSKTTMVGTETELDTRFRRLGISLNGELGFLDQSLLFRKVHDRSGQYYWWLENPKLSEMETSQFPGMACSLATAPDHGAQLYFSLNEQWVYTSGRLAFKSCNLHFLVASTDPIAVPIKFRLEWAGRDPSDKFRFPGDGAAHPHWQFDVEEAWLSPGQEASAQDAVSIDLEPSGEVEEVDLEREALDSIVVSRRGARRELRLDWFHKLHLPARAVWNDKLRDVHLDAVGQQHEPLTFDELDNWVVSALRYMRHEFSLYAY